MSDKKISQLSSATAIEGTEQIPVVQDAITKQTKARDLTNYYISKAQTAEADVDVDLAGDAYENTKILKLTWSGATGTAEYTLPDATTNTDRVLRVISDSTFSTNTRVHIKPKSGQNLDGSSSYYEVNKAYEGIAVWSDGTEWFVIQKKA